MLYRYCFVTVSVKALCMHKAIPLRIIKRSDCTIRVFDLSMLVQCTGVHLRSIQPIQYFHIYLCKIQILYFSMISHLGLHKDATQVV